MRIAITGAPGSGKSELAQIIHDEIVKGDIDCQKCHTPVAVIDDYAGPTSDRYDLAMGVQGDYLVNLAIAFERIALERHAVNTNKTIITVGTLLETSVYQALSFEGRSEFKDLPGEQEDFARRVEATLKTLACLYVDTFHYDHVFYVQPLGDPQHDEDMLRVFDRNLQSAFHAFFLTPVTPLYTDPDISREEVQAQRLALVVRALNLKENDEGTAQGAGTHATQTQ